MRQRNVATGTLAAISLAGFVLVGTAGARNSATAATDWPQWRGPAGTGVADGVALPTAWSEAENVAWKAPLPGLGVSSPIVWGDQVFVTYQVGRVPRRGGSHPSLTRAGDSGERLMGDPSGEMDRVAFGVASFHRQDGRLLWEHELELDGRLFPVHDKHNLASPSPVTDGERVYAWFGTGQIVAVDMNGNSAWQRQLDEGGDSFNIGWGHASSPTLYGDTLILQCDHGPSAYLLWLDASTGEEQRRVHRANSTTSYSTPTVVPGPQGDELIVNASQGLEAYDPHTGELLWHTGANNSFPVGVPTHEAGVLYTSRGHRSGPYMAIRMGGRGDITDSHVLWRVPTGAPYVSSVLLYRGHVYMSNGSGIVSAVEATSGERVWQERVGGVFSASPVAGDGKVYFVSEIGETVVVAAGEAPRVLARNSLNARVIASPAISAGQIFIRGDRHLIAVGS
ncbi:MAG TPA: PQQ-binding-like beta-propeller repeat protein [Acidobacteriota bacterium]|nr:PQQ-binding-like beta-propeller repeat protein [Acidobacteriota bacterium]